MEAFATGAWRTITGGEVFINGQWRALKFGEAYIEGQWREIASFVPNLSVAVNPIQINETAFGNSRPVRVTGAIGATPQGGTGPYTYVWTDLSGSLALGSPTFASTSVSAIVSPESEVTGTIRVVCTDATGATAMATAGVTLSSISFD